MKTKIVSCNTADSKPVKQAVNSTVILPPLVFLALTLGVPVKWFTTAEQCDYNISPALPFPLQHTTGLFDELSFD
jgi:hypothetical protein